ncbi:MAG: hypothetical protein PVG30_09095 [Gammaproteobacteria bacterium]|jgi:hypothetical protein
MSLPTKNILECENLLQETSLTSFPLTDNFENELEKKDIYAEYKDTTKGYDDAEIFMQNSLTNVPKSQYDNVIGWIKLRK